MKGDSQIVAREQLGKLPVMIENTLNDRGASDAHTDQLGKKKCLWLCQLFCIVLSNKNGPAQYQADKVTPS